MKLITKIKNIVFLYRANGDISLIKADHYQFFDRCLSFYRGKKNTTERNLLASIIKQLRAISPYKIQDYSKAKLLYNSIEPIDLSKVKVGDFVFKFSRKEPVKGKRWCEYHINESGSEGIYKVHRYSGSYDYFSLADYRGEWNHFTTLKDGTSRSFRFATKEEIKEFKNRQKGFKDQEKTIAQKYKEIQELRNSFNK